MKIMVIAFCQDVSYYVRSFFFHVGEACVRQAGLPSLSLNQEKLSKWLSSFLEFDQTIRLGNDGGLLEMGVAVGSWGRARR